MSNITDMFKNPLDNHTCLAVWSNVINTIHKKNALWDDDDHSKL